MRFSDNKQRERDLQSRASSSKGQVVDEDSLHMSRTLHCECTVDDGCNGDGRIQFVGGAYQDRNELTRSQATKPCLVECWSSSAEIDNRPPEIFPDIFGRTCSRQKNELIGISRAMSGTKLPVL